VTATEVNEPGFAEKFILRALIISLLLHLLVFSTYKIGRTQGWWVNRAMPRWLQAISRALTPAVPKKFVALAPAATPLVFVQVDPAKAVAEPPKAPKFYGANNTLAANPKIAKPSTVPDIRGQQDMVLKTTEDGKAKPQPLRPTPPPQPQTVAQTAAPKETYTPGDMAMLKPAQAAQPSTAATDSQSATNAPVHPVYDRPRTLAEANARQGSPGRMSHLEGGVNRLDLTSSLDVKGSVTGNYDRDFVNAVQARWDQLWGSRTPGSAGKVVLGFRLHPNGQITGMTNISNDVTDFMENMCEQAVLDAAPFQEWPREMKLELFPAEYRDIRFTFWYDQY
jgi:hypothetical protein